MEVKLFEVRDRATFIPCFAVLMVPTVHWALGIEGIDPEERYLLRRAGYDTEPALVLFGRLEGGYCHYDPYDWIGPARTMREAHQYVAENWKKLNSGDVVDVEFILGETRQPKVSERG